MQQHCLPRAGGAGLRRVRGEAGRDGGVGPPQLGLAAVPLVIDWCYNLHCALYSLFANKIFIDVKSTNKIKYREKLFFRRN